MYCKHGFCLNKAEHYCERHGGDERWSREETAKTERETQRRTEGRVQKKEGTRPVALENTSRGVVAPGEGLSAFKGLHSHGLGVPGLVLTPLPGTKAAKSRTEREAKRDERRAERLKHCPKGMGGQQKDEGGNGTSRKALRRAKKRSPGSHFYRSAIHGVAVKQKQ